MNAQASTTSATFARGPALRISAERCTDSRLYGRLRGVIDLIKGIVRGACFVGVLWFSLWFEWKAITWVATFLFGA